MRKVPKNPGALARIAMTRSADCARLAIVLACAGALILAG